MSTSKTVIISQGTVGLLDGKEISCANIAPRTYELAGQPKEGLTAYLALPDRPTWLLVGAGSSFDFYGNNWKIIKVEDRFVYLEEG